MRKKKILVCDDDDGILMMMETLLNRFNYETRTELDSRNVQHREHCILYARYRERI